MFHLGRLLAGVFFKDSTFPVIPPAAILEECQGKLLEIKFHLLLETLEKVMEGYMTAGLVTQTMEMTHQVLNPSC